ncbi:MAG: efflux RND transporter periplasmic adaptor subunit [bacterium]|nr:MAG: efflux RND transporter periplasmic adaptor subunit [bacterium]
MNRIATYILLTFILSMSLLQIHCSNGSADNKKNKDTATTAKDDTTTKNDTLTVDEEKNQKENKGEDLIPVETTVIKKGSISSYILLSSNLETEKMADVYSRVQGLVEKIYIEEGDYVKKGQVLMGLEADEYTLAEERALITYQQQKNMFERTESMYTKELLSKEEYEQAKFAFEGAKVEWQQAKLNLDYTKITSPISGVVVERLCRLGDRIQPSDKLFTVINTEEMIVVVYVPEKEIETILKGQKAYVTSSHLEKDQFPGWVKRVSPAVDPQSGTFKVTIGVRNINNKLRPGMFVNAHIITETHNNTILVPKTAIVYENENMNVFVVRDSIAHKIVLKVGFQNHEKVEALADIEAGDKVIVVGQAGLKDKTKVKTVIERES